MDTYEAVVSSYKNLLDQLEPNALRSMFVERRAIPSKEFTKICKSERRRSRASAFLRYITRRTSPEKRRSLILCFIDALMATGHEQIVQMISSRAGRVFLCLYNYRCLEFHEFQLDGIT